MTCTRSSSRRLEPALRAPGGAAADLGEAGDFPGEGLVAAVEARSSLAPPPFVLAACSRLRHMVMVANVVGDLPYISRRKNGSRQAIDLLFQKFNLTDQRIVIQNSVFFEGGHIWVAPLRSM